MDNNQQITRFWPRSFTFTAKWTFTWVNILQIMPWKVLDSHQALNSQEDCSLQSESLHWSLLGLFCNFSRILSLVKGLGSLKLKQHKTIIFPDLTICFFLNFCLMSLHETNPTYGHQGKWHLWRWNTSTPPLPLAPRPILTPWDKVISGPQEKCSSLVVHH